ncbi:MAG: phytoene desaturase [Acidobacteria bacterium]|nr:phytoene desaturase [Acidobacteriota bacterium]
MVRSSNREKQQKRVVIVGAGPGGLATAMLLARSGVHVTIVERHARVGGRTSTIEQDGFKFDIGPTFFLYPRVLREIFADAGYDLDHEVPMKRLDPQYRLIFGDGGQIDATSNVERMERQIAAISPHDAVEFKNFLARNRKKLASFMPVLETPFEQWSDLLKPEMLKLLPLMKPWLSLDGDLRAHFEDERIRLGFSFQSKYLGMSPFRCPSLFSILSFLEYEHGVFHPIGGCGAVTSAMARIAQEMGVEILTEEPVEEVLIESGGEGGRGKAAGVRTSKRRLQADAVVVNADFADAMRKLVPGKHRRKWSDRKIENKTYSCSTFMMYLGIDGRYDDVAHHTIYLAENYKQNLRDIEELHRLSENPSFYVQNASVTDPTLAPKGQSTLYVLLPVTHESAKVDWARETQKFRELALRQMERIGIRDVERRIRTEKIITPAGWSEDFGLFKGATFSMKHSLNQMLHLRPHNRFEDVDAMYLTGGGTHPGSGLPVIFQSARISSKLLLEDLGLETGWATSSEMPMGDDMMQVAS